MELWKKAYKLDVKSETSVNDFYYLLFKEFTSRLSPEFKLFNKTIPFHTVRIILGSFRYTKPQIRVITKRWNSLGLIESSKFRGIRLKCD